MTFDFSNSKTLRNGLLIVLVGLGGYSLFQHIIAPILMLVLGGFDIRSWYLVLLAPEGVELSGMLRADVLRTGARILPCGEFLHDVGNLLAIGVIIMICLKLFKRLESSNL